jgi:hypothetical protein
VPKPKTTARRRRKDTPWSGLPQMMAQAKLPKSHKPWMKRIGSTTFDNVSLLIRFSAPLFFASNSSCYRREPGGLTMLTPSAGRWHTERTAPTQHSRFFCRRSWVARHSMLWSCFCENGVWCLCPEVLLKEGRLASPNNHKADWTASLIGGVAYLTLQPIVLVET